MKQLKTLLGIVLYEQTIGVCEVEHKDRSYVVRKSGEYTLPKGVTIDNLASDSVDFKAFLKENGFRSKYAVIGLAAKQMISTQLQLPRIEDPQVRHDTIKINLERKLEIDFSDIVFDYDSAQKLDQGTISIVMLLRKKLLQVKELLRAVKITPVQITSTSLGLDLETQAGVTCHVIEYPASFELCLLRDNCLIAFQHVAKESELRLDIESARKIARQVSRICLSSGVTDSIHYCIQSPDDELYSNNKELLGIFGKAEFRNLKSTADCKLFGPAAALAGNLLVTQTERLNFLNGRHEEHKPTRLSQWIRKGVLPAAVVLILIGLFLSGWYSDTKQIKAHQQELDAMKAEVQEAQTMIDWVTFSKRWFEKKPDHLDILRELSLSFPQNSNIWLTSLAVDGSMNQILSGRAINEQSVLDVAESLRSKDMFDDVKILYIRKMGQGTDIMTFAINLKYGKEL